MLLHSENKQEKKLEYAGWTAFFLLCLLRFSYYGFRYFPQLDDYIQYHNYAYGKSFTGLWDEVQRLGLFGARPLAGLSDLYIWSAFWRCPYAAVLILTLMFALSALLLRQVFSRYFRTGALFYAIYLLFPLNFEGTYWMSASTRVCAGLFFAALSAALLIRFLERPRILTGALQVLAQLAACCFYEQVLVLSCVLMLLLWLLERKNGRRVLLAPASAVFSALSYFVCVRIFADSPLYRGRGGLVLPVSRYYFAEFLPGVLRQLYQTWIVGSLRVLWNGTRRGAALLLTDGAWAYTVICLLLCAAAGIYADRKSMIWTVGKAGEISPSGRARSASSPEPAASENGSPDGARHEAITAGEDRSQRAAAAGQDFSKSAADHDVTGTAPASGRARSASSPEPAVTESGSLGGARHEAMLAAESLPCGGASVEQNPMPVTASLSDAVASMGAESAENSRETVCAPDRKSSGKAADRECGRYLRQIVCGICLALAPMAVFFAVSNTWYSLRNTVPSLPGLALAADGAVQWMLCRAGRRGKAAVYALLTLLLTLPFMAASVSELHDYRQTWEDDQRVLGALHEFFDGDVPEEKIAVLNLEPSYLAESNFSWHEHIHGVTESKWALCGALTAQYQAPAARIYPIPLREALYMDWNYDDLHISGFSRVLWYDPGENAVEEVEVTDCGDGVFEVRRRGETVLIIRADGRSATAACPD